MVLASAPPPAPAPLPLPSLGQVERLLRELVAELVVTGWAAPGGRGRPAILPAAMLWCGVLLCVLDGWRSQADLWRLLTHHGVWDYRRVAISDQAVYHRLERDGPEPLRRLFAAVTALLHARLTPYAQSALAPFATEVYALDTTVLDPVARRLADLRAAPAEARLPGKLGEVFDVRRQQWARVQHTADAHANDKLHARALVAGLPAGSLLLFDLGYFAFAWFDDLTEAGYRWISRLRAKTSSTRLHVFYDDGQTLDAIVWLGAHRADRAKHAARLVEFRVGDRVQRYITNVLDPATLPIPMVADLYARRWDIEMAAQLVKEHLGLRLLWSSKPAVVLVQVWAVLVIAQVLQGLRLEIAGRAGVDVFEVSLPLLVQHLPRLVAAGQEPVDAFVTDGRRLGFIRPSRRIRIRAPVIPPEALAPRPAGLGLTRPPRHAGKT